MAAVHINSNRFNQTTRSDAYAALETEAIARSRQARGETRGIYRPDNANVRLTPERAVAEALESDPSIYEEYRAKHNASAILNTLTAAGIRIG